MTTSVDVCIAGGGPAGLVLGLLLARQGVKTLVVEKNEDFGREFRGEVLMPRFTQVFRQVGLDPLIERCVHRRLEAAEFRWRDRKIFAIRFAEVSPEVPYALWIPQPSLLGALHDEAKQCPTFDLWFDAAVKERIVEGGATVGLRVERGGALHDVRARVSVGAEGRFSKLRRSGGFEVEYEQHDFDVLWFSIPEPPDQPPAFRAFLTDERGFLALPKHPAQVQCGMVVKPDAWADYRRRGIEAFRADLLTGPRFVHDFARSLEDFGPIHPLQAKLDFVRRWAQDGLLLIGDAAHTCSPAGAIGVTIAVETAVVAADVLSRCLARGDVSAAALLEVQRRREEEVRQVHRRQIAFGRLVTGTGWWRRLLFIQFLRGLFALGIAQKQLRKLVVRSGPLDAGAAAGSAVHPPDA